MSLRPMRWVALYLGVAILLTWPLALHLNDQALGLANLDQMDTAMLRLVSARMLVDPSQWGWSTELAAPAGYPAHVLLPNWLDHISALPFTLLLPWPMGDNLWWLCVMAANGLAAHVLGYQVAGNHRAGVLCGVAFMASDSVLREFTFAHAPQAMVFFAPLYVVALLRVVSGKGGRGAVVAMGLCMAGAALTYWYHVLFLGVISLPIALWGLLEARSSGAVGRVARDLSLAAVLCVAVCIGPMLLTFGAWDDLPQTTGAQLPDLRYSDYSELVPQAWRWPFAQASDLLWPLRPTPIDKTNRLSLALIGACVAGASLSRRGARWPFLVAAGLVGVLIMGPYLKLGEDPALLGQTPIALPWRWLAATSDTIARFHWPQRWGYAVPLVLLPLAARAPRPLIWAAVLLVETLMLSAVAPVRNTSVEQFEGWRQLSQAEGSVFLFPTHRQGPRAGQIGFIYRAMERPMVVKPNLPPGTREPHEFLDWERDQPFASHLAKHRYRAPTRAPEGSEAALLADGVAAVALDATPGGVLGTQKLGAELQRLTIIMGREPVDYGSVYVWWLDPERPGPPSALSNPTLWRESQRTRLEREPKLDRASIMGPTPMTQMP